MLYRYITNLNSFPITYLSSSVIHLHHCRVDINWTSLIERMVTSYDQPPSYFGEAGILFNSSQYQPHFEV